MAQISEDLIIRFINNTCTDEELVAVRNWLEESDENAVKLFETEQMAMLAECIHDDGTIRDHISNGMKRRLIMEQIKPERHTLRYVTLWISGIAATLALIITAGIFMFKQPDVKIIHVSATSSSRSVILPDSTVVYLNNNSTLSYPEKFLSEIREVKLNGEGYFEVTKDKEHPFVVKGQHLCVEVLGTKFNFVSRDSLDSSVSLIDGSVEVSTSSQREGVVLVPGQKANYDIESGYLTVTDTKAIIDAAWHDRIIPFENASIDQICDILVQLYDVDIEIDPRIDQEKTYSGATVYYDKIDSTLTRLGYTVPIGFADRGGRIVISPL